MDYIMAVKKDSQTLCGPALAEKPPKSDRPPQSLGIFQSRGQQEPFCGTSSWG